MARILLVDDSMLMRRDLKNFFQEHGHVIVGEASNGEKALSEYVLHKPDLVTMDITMPNVDGISAIKNILKSFPEAKIVIISSVQQTNLVYEALLSGAKGYIVKPLKIEKAIKTIEAILNE
ncbi:MAG: response regulator [Bacillota bacterium]|nr:response regulator [Bacillota bacterium]